MMRRVSGLDGTIDRIYPIWLLTYYNYSIRDSRADLKRRTAEFDSGFWTMRNSQL